MTHPRKPAPSPPSPPRRPLRGLQLDRPQSSLAARRPVRFRRESKRGEGGARGRRSGGKPDPRTRTSPEAPADAVRSRLLRPARLLLHGEQEVEVVQTLQSKAEVDPGFTLVWQKLEEQNQEFFQGYAVRLQLKDQINLFNHLLDPPA